MRSKILVLALALALASSAAWAYTIYLKDGTKLVARDKYKVHNGLALIVLQNGTQTSIQVSEIDEPRTAQANQTNYGTAVVLDETGKVTDTPLDAPAPKRPELKDLIASRQNAPQPPVPTTATATATARRPAQSPAAPAPAGSGLAALPRQPLPRLELAAEIKQALRAKGIEDVLVFRGSRADRALLEITTNSEAAIFRSLEASAAALLELQARGIAALEVSMMSAGRERAGEFTLTPDLAATLAQKRIETSAFYVQNVQF